jgi:hypothetical protein
VVSESLLFIGLWVKLIGLGLGLFRDSGKSIGWNIFRNCGKIFANNHKKLLAKKPDAWHTLNRSEIEKVMKISQNLGIIQSVQGLTIGATRVIVQTKDFVVTFSGVKRGVDITPAPAHPETLCRLVKSLSLDVTTAVEGVVAEDAIKKGLTESEAIVRLMELRPNYPLGLAKKIVQFVFAKVQTGGIKQ